MSGAKTFASNAARRRSPGEAALFAAYREGLGLTAVAVVYSAAAIRIVACRHGGDVALAEGEVASARWWCRRAADAERVAAAATARLQRRESSDEAMVQAGKAVAAAAQRFGVALRADEDVCVEATAIIARVDQEMAALQRSGELKAVNRAYRTYRLEASARGEQVLRYADWINKYRQNLVRELAAALRFI